MSGAIVRSAVLALAASVAQAAVAAEVVSVRNVALLQPDSVLHERGAEAQHMAQYIRTAEATAGSVLRDEKPTPTAGFIVFAVREGYASKVWLDLVPPLPAATATKLTAALERTQHVPFVGGTIVFAFNVSLWDAAADTRTMPRPQAWIDAAENLPKPIEIGELVDHVWPRPAAK
jgi:hypothetical protein